MLHRFLALASVGFALVAPSFANVYVVDLHGGPGVDFTDIPPAVAAAHPGDVIRVHAGSTYSPFTLSIGVSILCDAGAGVHATITSIPGGQRAVVSGASIGSVLVTSCVGPVFLEGLNGFSATYPGTITIQSSADVRLRACTFATVVADGSRVEVTNSSLVGLRGEDGCAGVSCGVSHYEGTPGGPAISCVNSADVHVGASSLVGGRGGDGGYLSFCPNFPGGTGGDAIDVYSGTVLITGTGSETIAQGIGGAGNSNYSCASAGNGAPGNAIYAFGGTVLYSGVSTVGTVAGSATLVTPADPCLIVSGSGVPSTQLTYTIHGQPGDQARLRLGRQMVVNTLPGVFENQLTIPLRSYALGLLPASGQASFSINVPTSLPPNFVIVAQGTTTSPTGETRLTQSAPVALH